MANQELIRTLDYILNRCDGQAIEAVAAAVMRRRRDIAMFGSMPAALDPRSMAKELSAQLNIEGSIESLKNSVREFAIRTIRQEAPELTDSQVEELTRAWLPSSAAPGADGENPGGASSGKGASRGRADGSGGPAIPGDVLASMIDQFVSFSLGRMEEEEDRALRGELGPWPDKYWKAMPPAIRLLIADFLKGELNETEFNSRIGLALKMR